VSVVVVLCGRDCNGCVVRLVPFRDLEVFFWSVVFYPIFVLVLCRKSRAIFLGFPLVWSIVFLFHFQHGRAPNSPPPSWRF